MQVVLHEHYEVKWASDLMRVNGRHNVGRNKLRTYRCFKSVFDTEVYVKTVMSTTRRGAMAKFRSGTAPIRLETGRYENIPEPDRLCPVCDCNTVEHELHTLIHCPAYDEYRTVAFLEFDVLLPGFIDLDDEQKLYAILSNHDLVRPAAKFCQNILEQRRTLLYV